MTRAPDSSASGGQAVPNETTASGMSSLVTVYVCWGLFPLYWEKFAQIPPLEVVCHRSIHALGFGCIWAGIALYTLDSQRVRARR